ncbi:MAG: crosslink repair DNA glycosylase YcaQ family protein, partial [Ilumatobacteraceae bacterium]
MARASISAAQARRIALGAQGFARPRPTGRIDRRHLRNVLDHVGLIQIDSVNVLARSQELVVFARLGPHPRTLIHDATAAGDLFEYWVHEATHMPTAHHHLCRWMMDRPRMGWSLARLTEERPGFLDEVERYVADAGPTVASHLGQRDGPKGSWWDWDDGKVALEVLFSMGRLAAVRRPNDFARVYDLPERVLPAEVLARPAVPEHEARKELLVLAGSHHGVGTLADLADYHRMKPTVCKPLIDELVEDGRLLPVTVEGWNRPAYLHPDARIPRRVDARALLSPFDPVVWYRDRAERLFGFHYRIEIYVPKPKRQYGYYVLPFLLGDELVGRVDL